MHLLFSVFGSGLVSVRSQKSSGLFPNKANQQTVHRHTTDYSLCQSVWPSDPHSSTDILSATQPATKLVYFGLQCNIPVAKYRLAYCAMINQTLSGFSVFISVNIKLCALGCKEWSAHFGVNENK